MFFLLLFLDGLDIYRRVHMLTTTRRRSNSLNLISTHTAPQPGPASSRPISYTSLSDYKLLGLVFPSINCCAELFISDRAPSRTAVQLHLLGGLNQIFETFKSHGLIILYSMLFSCISHRCIINWGKRLNCKIK
jgi:hypothetical protein